MNRKTIIILSTLFFVISALPLLSQTQFFVSPTGSPGGDGSIANPWDLATALKHPASVLPGDTIWLRGGTYGTGGGLQFISTLKGTSAQPIIVRQYAGERAIIDGGIYATGGYIWYWGFEITNSSTVRTGPTTVRAPGLFFASNAPGNKAINMVIHDTGHPAIQFNNQSDQGEVYGCILWGAGIYDPTIGSGTTPVVRGDGIYSQNDTGSTYITDNITFWNFTVGAKAYGEGGKARGFKVRGNISFENGDRGLFFATNSSDPTNVVDGLAVTDNAVYQTVYGRKTLQVGYKGVNKDAVITDNYLVGGDSGTTAAFFVNQFQNVTLLRNTSVGMTAGKGSIAEIQPVAGATVTWDQNAYAGGWSTPFYYYFPSQGINTYQALSGWQAKTGFDSNSTYSASLPTGLKVIVRPNKYEPDRVNIAIFNWNLLSTVAVDVSSAVSVGTSYEIRDVENYFGSPVLTGIYDGSPIQIPMNLGTVTPLVGAVTHMPNIVHTAPRFGAFVLIPTSAKKAATPAISPNGGSFSSPVTVSLTASMSGASIFYTKDGSIPTANSTKYGGPFTLGSNTTIKAIAVKSGLQDSDVATASFTIKSADITLPAISGVSATSLTNNSAVIGWTTDEPADTQVEYGTTTAYGLLTPVNTATSTVHSIALVALNASTVYNYRVRSKDAAGNLAVSPNLTFKTAASVDNTPPVISAATATGATTSLAVTWNTNESSTSEVLYGTSAALGSTTGEVGTFVTNHRMTVGGLKANTTYYWSVRSKDPNGNRATSSTATVSTGGDTTPPKLSSIIAHPDITSATITFASSEGARCYVRYGRTPSYGGVTVANANLQTTFAIPITGLQPRTFYNFQIHCEDAALNAMNQPNRSFTTKF